MRDKAVIFGKTTRLVGVVTLPGREEAVKDAPALIVLNSGMVHRVGAGRLSVRMARVLATQGSPGLRFDFSGLGDSDNRTDGLPFEERCIAETREAMDYMAEKHKVEKYVLMGLCSGADIAFETGLQDPRVSGLVQIDPFVFRTPKFYLHYGAHLIQHHGPKLFRPDEWSRITRKFGGPLLRRLLGKRSLAEKYPGLVESPFQRLVPPKEYVANGLQTLVDRGVSIFTVFTGGMKDRYNHQSQYVDCFRSVDFAGRLTARYMPDADHTLQVPHLQEQFIEDVKFWLRGGGHNPLHNPPVHETAEPAPVKESPRAPIVRSV